MCFTKSGIVDVNRWNWDGGRIIHNSVVPSSRPVVGAAARRRKGQKAPSGYPIDAREFLVTEKNAVMRLTLEHTLRDFIEGTPGMSWAKFSARGPGCFDHRADVIAAFVGDQIKYVRTSGRDPWQFPDETLAIKAGDCEDRAFLLGSLLLASGVSSFNVRIGFGRLRMWMKDGRQRDRDHVWVMYKTEAGRWSVIEPLLARKIDAKSLETVERLKPTAVEYRPRFLFNDAHLWDLRPVKELKVDVEPALEETWSELHPTFAGAVHKTILNQALTPDICPAWVLQALNRHFHGAILGLGPIVDDVDADMSGYDPRDHFDNGYIAESWDLVNERLARFEVDNITNLFDFFRAAHAIADFYAHTSYMHFAKTGSDGYPKVCDPSDIASCVEVPDYSAGSTFDIESGTFTENEHLWKKGPVAGAAQWAGQLISGRYAQNKDTWPGLANAVIEGRTYIPKELLDAADFANRGALPHHNEIAVDDESRPSSHKLYSPADYADEYDAREQTAVKHIRATFAAHWMGGA